MSKILDAYGGSTATIIKARASVPTQGNMTVNGTTVEADNIMFSQIKGVLHSSSNTLYGLVEDGNVNQWSGFGPYRFLVSSGAIEFFVPDEHNMGCFAGYNHNAPQARGVGTYKPIGDYGYYWTTSTTTAEITIGCTLYLGEIDFTRYDETSYLMMEVRKYSDNTLVDNEIEYLYSEELNYDTSRTFTKNITVAYNQEYKINYYLCDSSKGISMVYPGTFETYIRMAHIVTPVEPVAELTISGDVLISIAGTATVDRTGYYTINITDLRWAGNIVYTDNINIQADIMGTPEDVVFDSNQRTFSGYLSTPVDYNFTVVFTVTNFK
jgi:hypothetical protein